MIDSIRIGGLTCYPEIVEELGGNPKNLCEDCGISYEVFKDEDHVISFSKRAELFEATAKALKKPDFGLYLGSLQKVDLLGLVSVVMQTAKTIGDAMKSNAEFMYVHTPAVHYSIDDEHPMYVRAEMNITLPNLSHRDIPQSTDFIVSVAQEVWRQMAREKFQILKVEIPHEPLLPIEMYEDYFDASIEFNSKSMAWYIPKDTYNSPLPLSSDKLNGFASEYLISHFPKQGSQFSLLVEREIHRLIESENCSKERIASSFNIHPKTMQRRLKQENNSFDVIRDRVRRERAVYYLCNTELSFGDISTLLGYMDQASFSRSCQRWFSKSAREIRIDRKFDV